MQSFSIRDNKAETYDLPFQRPNVSVAIRSCIDSLDRADSMWSKHPEDFALYHVGEWDDTAGKHSEQAPVHIINLIELIETEPLKAVEG